MVRDKLHTQVPKEYCYSENGNLTNGKLKSPLALELVANFPLSIQIYQSKSEADVLDSVIVVSGKALAESNLQLVPCIWHWICKLLLYFKPVPLVAEKIADSNE